MASKLLVALFTFFASTLSAQHICGTAEPSASEIDYIQNNIATLNLPRNGGTTCIPIKAHIVRETNGSGGLTLAELNQSVAGLNEYFFPAGIEFYFCGTAPNYIDNSSFYDYQSSEENALATAAGEDNNSVNMYFVNGIDDTGGPSFTAGYAYLPANSVQTTRVVIRRASATDGTTMIHEMGHHYSLLHTFAVAAGNELVNGSNCTAAGDLICDTPADPGFNGVNVDFNCNYVGTETDANGDLYNPQLENVMGYFPAFCQNPAILTPGQITRIEQGLLTRQGHFFYSMDCPASNVTDPSNLTATITGSTVVLNWADNSNNEMGFFIERSTTSATAGFEAFLDWGVPPNTTTFTDNSTVPSGTTFFYRVKASNDGCNEYSNVASVPTVTPTCAITNITAGTTSGCDLATNTYSQQVTVTYSNPPSGTININGQTFTQTNSPQTETLTNLNADGNAVNVTAFFTNETPCALTQNNAFTAPANCTVTPTCAISNITAGTTSGCDPATNTYSQQVTVTYSNPPSGTININGQTFTQTNSPQTETLTNLNADGNAVNVTAFFTNETPCALTQNNAFTAPANCTVTPTCAISNITAGTTSGCDPATNTYSQQVTVTYSNPPSGTININGQTFTQTNSPQTETLTNLNADGNAVNVTAFFTNETPCALTQNNAFTAPANCTVTPTCAITNITAGTTSGCDPATNTYSQQVTVTYSNPPSGTININGQTFTQTNSPQTETLTNLNADGNAVNVTAFFTNETPCALTQNNAFTAPANCTVTPTCAISNITAGTTSGCDPATNTYSQQVTVTYSNPPSGTININGQTFTQTNSPQTETLTNLNADGNAVNVTAFFTNETPCALTQNNAFTAPANCTVTPTCAITNITAGTTSGCDPATNTYSQQVTVTYSNPPSGTININGQTFTQTNSPQTETLTNLNADGNAVNITAFFTNETPCALTLNDVFIAPEDCGNTASFKDLVVLMIPENAGSVSVGNDIITSTPFTGNYLRFVPLNVSAQPLGGNSFTRWELNTTSLPDFNNPSSFVFSNQDTLIAYFNNAVSINESPSLIEQVRIYPTIFENQLTIEFSTNENIDLSIDLFNVEGRLIKNLQSQSIAGGTKQKQGFNVNVASGVYFIQVSSQQDSFVQKVIKL